MSRPVGSVTDSSKGRSTGRPIKHGARKADLQLIHGERLDGPGGDKLAEIARIYEEYGPRPLRELLALTTAAVALTQFDAVCVSLKEGREKAASTYGVRYGQLADKAERMLADLEARRNDGSDIILDAVEVAQDAQD